MDDIIEVFGGHQLVYGGQTYRCAIGRGGLSTDKREGDGATPIGTFALRSVLYRADRLQKPMCALHVKALEASDGWCDDPNHELYNFPVTLPFEGHHEDLWRDDAIYDIIVVLGYNDDPPVSPKGSAIFFHIARPDYSPTEGCVAIHARDMLDILTMITPDTVLRINP